MTHVNTNDLHCFPLHFMSLRHVQEISLTGSRGMIVIEGTNCIYIEYCTVRSSHKSTECWKYINFSGQNTTELSKGKYNIN